MARETNTPGDGTTYWRFLPIVIAIAGLGIGYALGLQRYLSLDFLSSKQVEITAFVSVNFAFSLVGFVVLYALAVAVSFPVTWVLTATGGFIFGWLIGGVASSIGATLGATALFWAARTAFGDFLRQRVKGVAARLADGFERDAFGYLLALRLVPVLPFFVVNIVPALFKVRLCVFVMATFIGIVPGCFVYAYLGQGLGSVLEKARQTGSSTTLANLITPQITLAFVGLALLATVPPVVRAIRARRIAGRH